MRRLPRNCLALELLKNCRLMSPSLENQFVSSASVREQVMADMMDPALLPQIILGSRLLSRRTLTTPCDINVLHSPL